MAGTNSGSSDRSGHSEGRSTELVFELLADRRRRYLLSCLQKYDNPMTLPDVADEVATWEAEVPISEISAEKVKRVYLSLYHSHVPKLEDAGVVEYSQEQDAVALTETADAVVSQLDEVNEME